jgi:hypothetical protein
MARIFLNRAANRANVALVRFGLMAGTMAVAILGLLMMSR